MINENLEDCLSSPNDDSKEKNEDKQEFFTVAINKCEFEKMDREARNEYIKNSAGQLVLKSRSLKGTWISAIAQKINEYEGTKYTMLGKSNLN